jgi:rhodanese-related sulfurtransferase
MNPPDLRQFSRFFLRLNLLLLVCLLGGPEASHAADAATAERRAAIKERWLTVIREFPSVDIIAVEKAALLLKRGEAVFVDVREAEEQAVSMIAGALRADAVDPIPQRFAGKTLILYCTIGHRSARFAREMAGRGITAYNLERGLLGWIDAGHPVFANGKAVRRVHVYGPDWDLAPPDYQTETFGFFRRLL